MRLFSLDNRLRLCASLVRKDCTLADIGTDHAYLPIWLVSNNVIKKAIACDINPLPLRKGTEDVNRYGLSDKIELRLSDGLKSVSENEADDIVIAGMGAELIIKIISECGFAKNSEKHFILQPMTKYELLISWLYENGFEIITQLACESSKKHYTVMLAYYTGNKKRADDYFCYVGKLDTNNPDSRAFLAHSVTNLEKRLVSNPDLSGVIDKIKEAIL